MNCEIIILFFEIIGNIIKKIINMQLFWVDYDSGARIAVLG